MWHISGILGAPPRRSHWALVSHHIKPIKNFDKGLRLAEPCLLEPVWPGRGRDVYTRAIERRAPDVSGSKDMFATVLE